MKTIRIFLIAVTVLFISCESKTKKENTQLKERVTQLEIENQEFRAQQKKLQTSIKGYRKFLGEINKNLKEIDISSSAVGELSTEIKKGTGIKEEVRMRMKTVLELIKNSKHKILALDSRLRELRQNARDQSEEILLLESELSQAIKELMQKEKEYLEMTTKLSGQFEEQKAITNDLQSILDRAFYFVGTSKELSTQGIIEKEGGFIGLGRVKMINANLPDSIFSKTSKLSFDSIALRAVKMNLITPHPNDSYEITRKGDKQVLAVTDKNAFWSKGNYLIIQVR